MSELKQIKQPISPKTITRLLVIIIVILSITTGYYQSLFKVEKLKYSRIEDKFVRVRSVLGREETQRLIDLTHEQDIETQNK